MKAHACWNCLGLGVVSVWMWDLMGTSRKLSWVPWRKKGYDCNNKTPGCWVFYVVGMCNLISDNLIHEFKWYLYFHIENVSSLKTGALVLIKIKYKMHVFTSILQIQTWNRAGSLRGIMSLLRILLFCVLSLQNWRRALRTDTAKFRVLWV